MTELKKIAVDKIRTNPVALREVDRQSESFIQLVLSVKEQGIINAINVRSKPGEDGKEFELIDGLQRFSAAQEAGLPEIPAQVLDRDDEQALITQIIANAHKIETRPVEYAQGMMRILGTNPTWTETQLAAKLNKSPQWVGKQLGLLRLHDTIRPLVDEGKIPVANAYALAKLPKEEQLNWIERAQILETTQFGTQALARAKEIRDANRKGTDTGEEQFIPTPHIRKKTEIEAEMAQAAMGPVLVEKTGVLRGIKNKDEAAAAGFALGIKWVLNMDPDSLTTAEQEFKVRKQKEAEAKIRRDAEKKQKKEAEATKKLEEAKKSAEEARKKAEQLPPVEAAVA